MILTPELQEKLTELRSSLPWEAFSSDKPQIEAATGNGGKTSVFSPELPEPEVEIEFDAFGEKLLFSARSFFQGNRFLIDKLVETALGGASGANALDLYCGVGLFTLPLARRFSNVTGIEENDEAVRFAHKECRECRAYEPRISCRECPSISCKCRRKRPRFRPARSAAVRDRKGNDGEPYPPRPRHVSYVSCDPSVLARDLKRFVENDYQILSITALDMFPQTHHVETVVHLTRSG
jgi:23S rRNA (uracil1939-C5)-methyltransferase